MWFWLILSRRQVRLGGLLIALSLVGGVIAAISPAVGHSVSVVGANALVGRMVVIDPGHGGPDPGAVGGTGVLEKDVVLQVSALIGDLISDAGGLALLTRSDDTDLSGRAVTEEASRKRAELAARVQVAIEHRADIFLSIHANKFGNGTPWQGAQVFWDPRGAPGSERLAMVLQEALASLTPTRRVHRPIDQFVLGRAPMPAATVELGFLSNRDDEALLASSEYQRTLALAIVAGLQRYLAGGT